MIKLAPTVPILSNRLVKPCVPNPFSNSGSTALPNGIATTMASVAAMVIAAVTVSFGFFPCLGWMNWFAVPFAVLPVVLGAVGLMADRDPNTMVSLNVGPHLAAVLGGILLMGIGMIRCALGGGLI